MIMLVLVGGTTGRCRRGGSVGELRLYGGVAVGGLEVLVQRGVLGRGVGFLIAGAGRDDGERGDGWYPGGADIFLHWLLPMGGSLSRAVGARPKRRVSVGRALRSRSPLDG